MYYKSLSSARTSRKKRLFPFFFFLFLFLFIAGIYGCQLIKPKDQPSSDKTSPVERRTGILKSFGEIVFSQGTHFLQLQDGSILLLKSAKVDLNNKQYLYHQVEAGGVITLSSDGKEIMDVLNIDLLDEKDSFPVQPALKTSSQVSWKQYRNQDLDIALSYPEDVEIAVQKQEVHFQRIYTAEGSSKPFIHEFILEKENIETVQQLAPYFDADASGELSALGMSRSRIGKDNIDAIKKSENGNAIITYYFQHNGSLYSLKMILGQDGKSLADKNLFYEMLTTFQLSGSEKIS